MSVVDILGTKFIDAAGAIVPMVLFYAVGKWGTFRRIRKTRFGAILYHGGEDDRRLWNANVAIISMGVGAFFASSALLGVPLT